MAPMHAKKRKEASHVPGRARHSVRAIVRHCQTGAQRTDAPYHAACFMGSMRVRMLEVLPTHENLHRQRQSSESDPATAGITAARRARLCENCSKPGQQVEALRAGTSRAPERVWSPVAAASVA